MTETSCIQKEKIQFKPPMIAQSTEILKIVIIVAALALEVFVFCKDVKRFIQLLKPGKEK